MNICNDETRGETQGSPQKKLAKKSPKAASSLTCVKVDSLDQKKPDCDFAYCDIDNIRDHQQKDVIIGLLKVIFTEKTKKLQNSSNDPEILSCQAQIATRLRRIHVKGSNPMTIRNEATVRYVYGDPIVDMIIDSFGYKLEIEETVSKDESLVDISSGSKTDYCCWRLYKKERRASTTACITVLETKHERNLYSKHYAQVLGYFCYNKEPIDHSGIAILLNEYAGKVSVGFFIFPYLANETDNTSWALQALLLPIYTCESADVIKKGTFLELIYFFCMDCDRDVPRLVCPEKVIGPRQVVGVLTEHEYMENIIQQRDQAVQAVQAKDQELQAKDQELQTALQTIQALTQEIENSR